MPTLLFMPWCPIDKTYVVGDITIAPFHRYEPIVGLDDATNCRVNTVVSIYKDINKRPVSKAALVYFTNKGATEKLDGSQVEIAHEVVALGCFSALAKREYFASSELYCNADCFTLHLRSFSGEPIVALETRKREGSTLAGWAMDDVAITIPVHCHLCKNISLDETLLMALINQRTELLTTNEWGRWQNAISCFNWANTDNSDIDYRMEWVLLCSAFEHFLGACYRTRDVADEFSNAFLPSTERMAASSSRLTTEQKSRGQSLRCEWMKEFHRIRGDYAHGRLNTQQPMTWKPLEHLVFAAITFPLLVKSVLCKDGKYTLTDNDHAQIDSFETFADTKDCLEPPQDQTNSMDSHWGRLVGPNLQSRQHRKQVDELLQNNNPNANEKNI